MRPLTTAIVPCSNGRVEGGERIFLLHARLAAYVSHIRRVFADVDGRVSLLRVAQCTARNACCHVFSPHLRASIGSGGSGLHIALPGQHLAVQQDLLSIDEGFHVKASGIGDRSCARHGDDRTTAMSSLSKLGENQDCTKGNLPPSSALVCEQIGGMCPFPTAFPLVSV